MQSIRNLFRRFLFQLWYYRDPPWDTGISPPELMDYIQRHQPGRALDMGCGTGTNAITLASYGWEATGIDFAWRAIREAENKAQQSGVQVRFLVGDVSKPEVLGEVFNLVLDIGCYHNLPDAARARYSANLPSLLAPGGTFLLYAFFRQPVKISSGITSDDIHLFQKYLTLTNRQDGTERGRRPSTWLEFHMNK